MGAVVGITTYLQAKNKLSPELQEVVKSAQRSKKELDQLDDTTKELVKEMRNIKKAAEQNERAFRSEMQKMQQEVAELRGELRALGSVKAKPQVQIDDQARRQISAIESDLKSLDGQKATATVEVDASQNGALMLAGGAAGGAAIVGGGSILDEIIAVSQAKARYDTMTAQSDQATNKKLIDSLMAINPNADKTAVIDLLTKSTLYDAKSGSQVTKQALQLETIRPDMGNADEYQKAMLSMQNSWKGVDVTRLGDTIAMIQNSSDLRGEALESILEYSTQMSKFLDAPEKLAALAQQVDVWSQDKMYDALKETTLKLYNKGDLTNALKTAYEDGYGMESKAAKEKAGKEADDITKALSSGNVADRQFAVAALMQAFGTIKDDTVRQQLLNEIGAGPGEDLNTQVFADLLKTAGEIGMADPSKFNYSGKLDSQYEKVKENDPLRDFVDAKNLVKTELIDLGTAIAEDAAPALEAFASTVKWAKEKMDGMSSWGSLAIVGTTALIVGGSLVLFGTAVSRATNALFDLAASKIKRRKGGGDDGDDGPDIDVPDRDRKKGSGKKKRGLFRFGKKETPDIDPPKNLTYAEKSELALKKQREAKDAAPKKTSVKERLGGMVDTAKDWGGKALEGTKSFGKGLLKRLPLIGTVAAAGYGVKEILGAENKKEAALRVGANVAGGAIGGAAMGAAVGSIVPGLGTAIGGAIGAALGGIGADRLFDKAKAWWDKPKETPKPEPPPKPPAPPPKPPVPPPPPPPAVRPAVAPVVGVAAGAALGLGGVAAIGPAVMGIFDKIKQSLALAAPPKPPALPPKPIPHPGTAAVTQQVKQDIKVQTTAGPVSLTMNAQGILQDVNGLVRLLGNGTVQSTIKGFVLPAVEKGIVDAIQTRGGPPAPTAPSPGKTVPGGNS